MKKLQLLIVATLSCLGLLLVPMQLVQAETTNQIICGQINATQGTTGVSCKGGQSGLTGFIGQLINGFIFIVGGLSVIMIIVGGVMYVTSSGSPDGTKRATGVILSAVIGLVLATLAYALVNFVLKRLFPS